MEAGFLLGKEVSKKGSLAHKVKNIKGKLLGKDGKSLKSILKSGKVNPNQVILDVGSCMNSIDRVGTTVDKSSITQGSNDNRMPIHAAIVKETIPVTDVNASTLNSGTNDLLGVDIDGTNKCGVYVHLLGYNKGNMSYTILPLVDEISDKFANTSYGYFIGDRLAFPIVEAYIKNAWAKYGLERAIFHNGFFFFKFLSHEGMVKTIEGGHWFIRCMSIFLNIWTTNTKLKREEITRVPVWVKIHNVPVVAFSEVGLSLIATKLGRPIMLDACTSDMCLNPHNSFARVLVELSSKCAVMESIVVAIPLPKGEEHYLETLNVEYDWWPPQCSKCKIFDHVDEFYPSWGKKVALDLLAGEGRIHDTIIKQKKRPVSKPITSKDDTSKQNMNVPPIKEVVNEAAIQPNVSKQVNTNDSSCPTNEYGYFKDDIDLGQLRSHVEKRMEEEKVLDISTENDTIDVGDTNTYVVSSKSINSAPSKVKESDKGSLWEQFKKSRKALTSKHSSSKSDSKESEVEEVCRPSVIPGGCFLDGLEDDSDCFDSYEAQVYYLTEREQTFCDQYDICLNCRRMK
ncbi:zinc knuckle CX2CX4HX4C containing protein [Tanacetum coccineum]